MKIQVINSLRIKEIYKILLLLFIFLFPIIGESAEEIDTFSPYVYTSIVKNSNIFKIANDNEAIAVLGDTKKDDTIHNAGAGIKVKLPLSRQQLDIEASVKKQKFDHFDFLDHTQTDGKANWKWQVGNLFGGNLGYNYNERLSEYYELQSLSKEISKQNVSYFDGGYQFLPDWRLGLGVKKSVYSYKIRDNLDSEYKSSTIGLVYQNTLSTRIGLETKLTDANFQHLEDIGGTLVDNDYKKTEIYGSFYWLGTKQSHFEAQFGSVAQKYNDLTERNNKSVTGRIFYHWYVSDKTKLDFSIWRNTDSRFEDVTTNVVTKGISFLPRWTPTGKITVNAKLSYEHDDYDTFTADILGGSGSKRKDDLRIVNIRVKYSPTNYASLSASYEKGVRTANETLSEFAYNQVTAQAQLDF